MATLDYHSKCIEAHGERCDHCGSDENVAAHHIDGDHSNHSVDNLLPLCGECHAKVHAGDSELQDLVEKLPETPERHSTVTITTRAEPSLQGELDVIAEQRTVPRAQVVRDVLREGLNDEPGDKAREEIHRLERENERLREKCEGKDRELELLEKQTERLEALLESAVSP